MPRILLRLSPDFSLDEKRIREWLKKKRPTTRSRGRAKMPTRALALSHALEAWNNKLDAGQQYTLEELKADMEDYYSFARIESEQGIPRKETSTNIEDEAYNQALRIWNHLHAEKERLQFPGSIPNSKSEFNLRLVLYLAVRRRARELKALENETNKVS